MASKFQNHVPLVEKNGNNKKNAKLLASDALPLPVWLTNRIFIVLFFVASYYLLGRWGEKKIRSSTPLHILSFGDIVAFVAVIASFIYLLGFFGIDYVQQALKSTDGQWDFTEGTESVSQNCGIVSNAPPLSKPPPLQLEGKDLHENGDEDIAYAVSCGSIASHTLESNLGDAKRAAVIRQRAVEMITGRSLMGLPLEGLDYASVLGQCCEMVIGHVQIPVGVAGPLFLDGYEYMVPMATTEGCLVASTNRGCKAIHMSGGATSVILRDGMTRAPAVRFSCARRAAEMKFYIEDAANFETICMIFNR